MIPKYFSCNNFNWSVFFHFIVPMIMIHDKLNIYLQFFRKKYEIIIYRQHNLFLRIPLPTDNSFYEIKWKENWSNNNIYRFLVKIDDFIIYELQNLYTSFTENLFYNLSFIKNKEPDEDNFFIKDSLGNVFHSFKLDIIETYPFSFHLQLLNDCLYKVSENITIYPSLPLNSIPTTKDYEILLETINLFCINHSLSFEKFSKKHYFPDIWKISGFFKHCYTNNQDLFLEGLLTTTINYPLLE